MSMKTLIAYSTRYGSTAKTAALLAQTLAQTDGREVTVVDARRVDRAGIETNDNFIVGSSIAMGRWKRGALRLIETLAREDKPVAVFVTAGGTLSGREPGSGADAAPKGSLEEREAAAVSLYLRPVVDASGLRPVAQAAFGGRFAFFGKLVLDNWDPERVRLWAACLASVLR